MHPDFSIECRGEGIEDQATRSPHLNDKLLFEE